MTTHTFAGTAPPVTPKTTQPNCSLKVLQNKGFQREPHYARNAAIIPVRNIPSNVPAPPILAIGAPSSAI